MSPLGLKTSGAYWRAVRNQDSSLEEHMYRFAYYGSQCRGSGLKTAWGSGPGPGPGPVAPVLLSTRVEAAIADESVHIQRE